MVSDKEMKEVFLVLELHLYSWTFYFHKDVDETEGRQKTEKKHDLKKKKSRNGLKKKNSYALCKTKNAIKQSRIEVFEEYI